MRPRLILTFLCLMASAQPAIAQNRGGFTAIATLGWGLQSNNEVEVDVNYSGDVRTYGGGTYSSWAGLNLGLGGFLTRDVALMFRLSGTSFTAKYIDALRMENETDVVSGVAVLAVQYWFTNQFNMEGGAGWGIVSNEQDDDVGLGLLLAAGYSFYHNSRFSFQLGIEDAVYHKDNRTVNSLGFCLGVQLL